MVSSEKWTFQTPAGYDFFSVSSPGMTYAGEELFMAWPAHDGKRMYFAQTKQLVWGRWATAQDPKKADFATTAAPAVAFVKGRVFVAWKGFDADTRIWWSSYSLSEKVWTDQVIAADIDGVTFGTSDGPAFAAVGDTIVMAWKGQGDDTRIWTSTLDLVKKAWSPQTALAGADKVQFGTSARPALANLNGRLVLAWRGSGDPNLWYSIHDPATNQWSNQEMARGPDGNAYASSHGPALAATGAEVVMAWKGAKDDVNIWQSTLTLATGRPVWANQQKSSGDGVQFGAAEQPALAGNQYGVAMTWHGSGDLSIWYSVNDTKPNPNRLVVEPCQDHRRWMERLSREVPGFGSLQLRQMLLPGCHQAGAYRLERNLGQAPDMAGFVSVLDNFGLAASDIQTWGQTHGVDVYGQLAAGSRYLDLRVAPCIFKDAEPYTFHSLFCVPWKEIVADIKRFATENPTEIVILNINPDWMPDNHDVYFRPMGIPSVFEKRYPVTKEVFLRQLQDELGALLVPPSIGPRATYDEIRKTGRNLICMVNTNVLNDDRKTRYPDMWGSGAPGAYAPYPDKADIGLAIIEIDKYLRESPRGPYTSNWPYNGFHGFQAIITPDTGLIVSKKVACLTRPYFFTDKKAMDEVSSRQDQVSKLMGETMAFHQILTSQLGAGLLVDGRNVGLLIIDAIDQVTGQAIVDLCVHVTSQRCQGTQDW